MKFGTCDISNIQISILISKIIFIKYLQPVRPKLLSKFKVHRIYWNLAHLIFQIWQSRFWCQKWFILNIYHLLVPDWYQNRKCSGFIEIWYIWYFEYPTSILLSKIIFYQIFINCYAQIGPKIKNAQNLLKFDKNWNLVKIFDKKYFNKFWAFLIFELIWG